MRACVMGLVVFAILGNTVCGVLPTVGLTQKRFFSLANSKELFEDFVSRFHRTYSGAQEYQTRFQIFQETLRQINERNAQEKEAVHGVTRFADRSLEEREKMQGTQVPPPFLSSRFTQNGAGGAYVRPPPANCSKNWVAGHSGYYTIRNQAACGNCWSYGVAETIRDNFIQRYGKDPGRLSSQYLTDCAVPAWTCSNDSNVKNGCCGGDPFKAMNWIAEHGIATTDDYGGEKYDASLLANVSKSGLDPNKAFKCKASVPRMITTTTVPQLITGSGYFNLTDERIDYLQRLRRENGTVAAMKYACLHFGFFCPINGTHQLRSPEPYMVNQICNVGPIIIGVCGKSLSTYVSGVLTADSCCNVLSHSVEAVGFDREKQAYIVRNSWGGLGGEESNFGVSPFSPYERYHQLPDGNWTQGGYFLLKYGENACQVATAAMKTPELAYTEAK